MLRILFAHPDQKLSQMYSRHLDEHFLVDSVHDGLSASRKIRVARPSLIISEYRLPLLSGVALLRFVRNHSTLHSLPFIFLSDHPDNSEALSFGANDWIELNNCHPQYLMEKIYHHLRSNRYGVQVY